MRFVSSLTENHKLVFTNGGFKNVCEYTYWNEKTRNIDLEGMLKDLRAAPENAVIILHPCAHNPTGCDPTPEQWGEIADVMEKKGLFPLFDCAYQVNVRSNRIESNRIESHRIASHRIASHRIQ